MPGPAERAIDRRFARPWFQCAQDFCEQHRAVLPGGRASLTSLHADLLFRALTSVMTIPATNMKRGRSLELASCLQYTNVPVGEFLLQLPLARTSLRAVNRKHHDSRAVSQVRQEAGAR